MSANKFDDFLNQSFSGYSPEVPPHIWENIAAEINKKRPGFFWLNEKKALLILAALLLAGAGIYMMAAKKIILKILPMKILAAGRGLKTQYLPLFYRIKTKRALQLLPVIQTGNQKKIKKLSLQKMT